MFNHHILPALACKRRKALLAEAGTSVARRSPLGWLPNWLRPDRSRWRSRPLHQPAVEDDDSGAGRLGAGQLKSSCQPPANCRSPRMDADADATMTARPVTRPGVCADVRDGRAGGGVAHRPRRAARGEAVLLRDGSNVLIRQVQSTDAPLLADGFTRLSAQSRQMRFLTRKKELSPADLRYFTDVDHNDHEAIGALSAADGRGVGIARYVRDADDPQAAEIAVTIVDDWQGRGLATELLTQLAGRARSEGIHRLTALVAADNAAVAGLAQAMGADRVGRGRGTAEYEIALDPQEEYSHARLAPRCA